MKTSFAQRRANKKWRKNHKAYFRNYMKNRRHQLKKDMELVKKFHLDDK